MTVVLRYVVSIIALLNLLVIFQPGQVSAACTNCGGNNAAIPPPPITPTPSPYRVDISSLPSVPTGPGEIKAILDVVFAVMGAISLLVVTIGGFRYVASQGDPQATAKAKGTITFALVGLLISILAVAIVTFVIGRTT